MSEGSPSPAAMEAAHELMEKLQKLAASEARALIEKQDFGLDRYEGVFGELLEDTSDRAAAITVYALFDDVLLEVFAKYFDPDVPGGVDSILNPSAFLGASSNRLKLAMALGWITNDVYRHVNILRNVRNRFAHRVDIRSFDDNQISGYIASLEHTPAAKNAVSLTADKIKAQSKRTQFIFRSVSTFQRFVLQIAVQPYAMKFRVNPRYIYGNADEWPRNLYHMLGETEDIANKLIDTFGAVG